MYMRVGVTRKQKEATLASYRRRQKVYNAIDNKWDVCSEFDFVDDGSVDSKSDTSSDSEDYEPYYNVDQEYLDPIPSDTSLVNELTRELEVAEMNTESDEAFAQESYFLRDVLEMLHYGYGYVPSLPGISVKACPASEMKSVLNSLGLHLNLSEIDLAPQECATTKLFLSCLLGSPSCSLPVDIYDLNDRNHLSLSYLVDFPAIIRSPKNLFLFTDLDLKHVIGYLESNRLLWLYTFVN